MGKIKKNLSDHDMLKNWHEQDSFETNFDQSDEPVTRVGGAKKAAKEESFLPDDVHKKLEQFVLDVRLEYFRRGVKEVKWKISRTPDGILLVPNSK